MRREWPVRLTPHASRLTSCALLLAVCFLAFFWRLGAIGLFDFNEGFYTEAAREMALRGDFITPRVNGVFFFDKPPLALWQSAVSLRLFGHSEFAARLPVAVAAALLVLLVYAFGARFFGRRAGLFAALALALNGLYFGTARQMTMDIHQSLWFGVAIFSFFLGYTAETRAGKWWYLGLWAGCGLSFLAKSVPGLFPLPAALAFVVLHERFDWRAILRRVREAKPLLGIALLVAIVAPWFVLVYRANGHFFYEQYWLLHHVKLANGTEFEHAQPFWYYVPALLAGLFPWSLFLPWAIRSAWRNADLSPRPSPLPLAARSSLGKGEADYDGGTVPLSPASLRANGGEGTGVRGDAPTARLFLLVWAAVVLLLFTLMVSKLVSYLLPMYAAAALLIGDWLARATEEPRAGWRAGGVRWGITLGTGLAAVALVVGMKVGHKVLTAPQAEDARKAVPPAVIIFAERSLVLGAVGMAAACTLVWARRPRAGVWAMVGTLVVFLAVADTEGLAAMDASMNRPLQDMARLAGDHFLHGTPVAVHIAGPTRPSVFFYLPDSAFQTARLPGPLEPGIVMSNGEKPAIQAWLTTHRPASILTDRKRATALLADTPGLTVERETRFWALLHAAPLVTR